jgi:hypothetical protein
MENGLGGGHARVQFELSEQNFGSRFFAHVHSLGMGKVSSIANC